MNNNINIISDTKLKSIREWEVEITCENGLGNEIGISVRNCMMSKAPSYSVVAFYARTKNSKDLNTIDKFNTANSIFSIVPGIGSLVDFSNKLANLNFQVENFDFLDENAPYEMYLTANSAGDIFASKFKSKDNKIKIINADDISILHLDDNITLEASIIIQCNCGIIDSQEQKIDTGISYDGLSMPVDADNYIPINSCHSILKNVTYNVQSNGQGEIVRMKGITTNNSIDPGAMIAFAVYYIYTSCGNLIDESDLPQADDSSQSEDNIIDTSSILHQSIELVGLPSTKTKTLQGADINTIGDLLETTLDKIISIRGIGLTTVAVIKNWVTKQGLYFQNNEENHKNEQK